MAYRYLFEQMVRRELRQKYRGSALGVLWYVINPLVLMGAYYLMFGVIFDQASEPDYPLFLLVGLVVWVFFNRLSSARRRRCWTRARSCARRASRARSSRRRS